MIHGWSFALHGAARSCTGQPAAWSCTDRQATAAARRCTDRQATAAARRCTDVRPHGPSHLSYSQPPLHLTKKIYLAATILTDMEVHGPPCMSCTALHGPEDQLCCTELHGPPCDPPLHGVTRTGRNSTMHGIAWIPCSCLVIFSWLHCTAWQLPVLTTRCGKVANAAFGNALEMVA